MTSTTTAIEIFLQIHYSHTNIDLSSKAHQFFDMSDSYMYLHSSHGRICCVSQAYNSNLRKPAFPLHQTHENIVCLLVKMVRLTLNVSTTHMAKSRKDAKATAESQTSTTVLVSGTRIPSVNKK
jgi:hypothetical protein